MAGKKGILVVDDDADVVESARIVLENEGYDVSTARSGAECLASARETHPDLIILDLMMETDSDGMLAAQELKKDAKTGDIPIVVVSGVNQKSPYDIVPTPGWLPVDAMAEKPIPASTLLELVRGQIGPAGEPAVVYKAGS